MKVSSRKQKGRRLQQQVAELIRQRFGLPAADVQSTPMGAAGLDVQLSTKARQVFPFGVECKNHQRLNVWKAIEQAETNAGSLVPLVVFKRNRSQIYCTLPFEALLDIIGGSQIVSKRF